MDHVPVVIRVSPTELFSRSVVAEQNIMSDPCSFSSFTRCVTKHLNLSLHLDFARHVIRGRVELTVEALQDRFSALVTFTASLKANGSFIEQPLYEVRFVGTPVRDDSLGFTR